MPDSVFISRFGRLSPTLALAAVIAMLLAGAVVAIYNERSYRIQKTREIGVQAQILASSVTAALVFDDDGAAREYINALAANPEVEAAAVYDGGGTLFAGFARADTPALPAAVAVRAPVWNDERLAVVAQVVQAETPIGTVYLRTRTEPMAQRLARYGPTALLIVMASLALVVLGAAQAALRRANDQLAQRARDLAATNRELHAQIEEREKAEEALRQSQKMEAIGQLSGGIAHDFNNLLTVVQGNLQLLRKRLGEGRVDVAHYIDLAMDGLNRASSLTQRILAFSRRQPLSPKSVDLNRLIVDMDGLVRHSLGARISIDASLDADWRMLCDPNQMENVLLNLAINARDAMPEGGQLTIRTDNLKVADETPPFDGVPAGDYVRLLVADTGTGMSDEVRRRAVDPFFTTKPPGQGTGLGLSMIFGYIKQSKGYLHIASELGRGTAITILMPRDEGAAVVEESEEVRPAVVPAQAAPPAKAPTVLIVEDEALVRMLAVETIRDEGLTVLEEGDGESALALLDTDVEIDLLITDVKLPGRTGYELAAAGIARRPDLKVLLMTGFSKDPVPEALANAGVKVLYKPYDLEDLAANAQRMLKEAECAAAAKAKV